MDIPIKLEYTASLKDADLQILKGKLLKLHLKLSVFNKNTKKNNYFDSYAAANCLIINPKAYELIQKEESKKRWNAILESIKAIRKLIKPLQESYGLQVLLDANTIFNFKLDHTFDEKTFDSACDKMSNFLLEQKPIVGFGNPYFVYFMKDVGQWKKVEVLDLLEEEEFVPSSNKKNWKSKKKKRK